jgi:hypothetical protein
MYRTQIHQKRLPRFYGRPSIDWCTEPGGVTARRAQGARVPAAHGRRINSPSGVQTTREFAGRPKKRNGLGQGACISR